MHADDEIAAAVLVEFGWEPRLEGRSISVLASDGVVFLRGKARSFAEKVAASRAAGRATGVRHVHNELEIVLDGCDRRADEDLRQAAVDALAAEPHVPPGAIEVDVSSGVVTLRGGVEQPLQIDASEAAVRRLTGLVDLRNELRLRRNAT